MRLTYLGGLCAAALLASSLSQAKPVRDECADLATYAEQVICRDADMMDGAQEMLGLIRNVRDITDEDGIDIMPLYRRLNTMRSYCASKDCVQDWLIRGTALWETLYKGAQENLAVEALTQALQSDFTPSDFTAPRTSETMHQMREVCAKSEGNSAAACLVAAVSDIKAGESFFEIGCQNGPNAAAALSCSLLGLEMDTGSRGTTSAQRSLNYLERACRMKSAVACDTLGDRLLADGRDSDAVRMYKLAEKFGSAEGRLAALAQDKDMLLLRIHSSATPAEAELVRFCEAGGQSPHYVLNCEDYIRTNFYGKAKKAVQALNLRDHIVSNVDDNLRRRSGFIANMMNLIYGETTQARAYAVRETTASVARFVALLRLLSQGQRDYLAAQVEELSEGHCETLDDVKAYLDKHNKLAQTHIKTFLPNADRRVPKLQQQLRWFHSYNEKLAKSLGSALPEEDGLLMESLILLEDKVEWQRLVKGLQTE